MTAGDYKASQSECWRLSGLLQSVAVGDYSEAVGDYHGYNRVTFRIITTTAQSASWGLSRLLKSAAVRDYQDYYSVTDGNYQDNSTVMMETAATTMMILNTS